MPNPRNCIERDSNTRSLDCEAGILPLNIRATQGVSLYRGTLSFGPVREQEQEQEQEVYC